MNPPFNEGDIVRIKDNHHLGVHRVDSCEWFDRTSRGIPSYWLCECTEIRDPIDWSKYPPGTTGSSRIQAGEDRLITWSQ